MHDEHITTVNRARLRLRTRNNDSDIVRRTVVYESISRPILFDLVDHRLQHDLRMLQPATAGVHPCGIRRSTAPYEQTIVDCAEFHQGADLLAEDVPDGPFGVALPLCEFRR